MTEKKEQTIQTVQVAKTGDELRFFPFAVAGIVCFTIAVMLGTGSWLVFGSRNRLNTAVPETVVVKVTEPAAEVPSGPPPTPAVETTVAPTPEVVQPPTQKFENVVEVPGGEIGLGGGDTKLPLQRAVVRPFLIAETEVTNAQYAEFLKATGHRAPAGWKDAEFPKGTADYPVSNVSVDDAQAFCKWLGTKLGAPVRLPTEAEWEAIAERSPPHHGNFVDDGHLHPLPTPTASKPTSLEPKQLFGDVWEWTASPYAAYPGFRTLEGALGEYNGKFMCNQMILRGGSCFTPRGHARASYRNFFAPEARWQMTGLRLAR